MTHTCEQQKGNDWAGRSLVKRHTILCMRLRLCFKVSLLAGYQQGYLGDWLCINVNKEDKKDTNSSSHQLPPRRKDDLQRVSVTLWWFNPVCSTFTSLCHFVVNKLEQHIAENHKFSCLVVFRFCVFFGAVI